MATVVTNYPIVVARLGALPAAAAAAIGRGLRRGLEYTRSIVQREYLQGPRPTRLGERSTRLRQSITTGVTSTSDHVQGRIGTNVEYAAFHEFGFHGIQNVRAHTRVVGFKKPPKNLGKLRGAIHDSEGRFVGYKRTLSQVAARRPSAGAVMQHVSAHTRKVNYRGRPFIRPALVRCEKQIADEVLREVGLGLQAV